MTQSPEPLPTASADPENLTRELEGRMATPSWTLSEFLLRICGLCWIIFATCLATFVPLSQIGRLTEPETHEGPGKTTVTVLPDDKAAVVLESKDWAALAGTVALAGVIGWGMAKGRRWGAALGSALSLVAIGWFLLGAFHKGGSGVWGLALVAVILLGVAPVSTVRSWWFLK